MTPPAWMKPFFEALPDKLRRKLSIDDLDKLWAAFKSSTDLERDQLLARIKELEGKRNVCDCTPCPECRCSACPSRGVM